MKIDKDKFKEEVEKAQARDPDLTLGDIAKAGGYQADSRIYQLMKGIGTNVNPRIGEALAKKLKCKTADITAQEAA